MRPKVAKAVDVVGLQELNKKGAWKRLTYLLAMRPGTVFNN